MTGYGRGTSERDGQRLVVEMRSVNHRYLDLKIRGGGLDPALEDRIATLVRGRLARGSVTVNVRSERRSSAQTLRVDFAAARRAHGELTQLVELLNLEGGISADLLCAQPGVLIVSESESQIDSLVEAAGAATDDCLRALLEMRAAEGAALATDLKSRLEKLLSLAESLGSLVAGQPELAQKRLNERIGRLLTNVGVDVDQDRLAHEVALLADRQDVTEELVRIRSHVAQAVKLLQKSEKAVGRRLDFLVQELGREFNTISSKSQSAEIASTVVEAKAELEKIREQVQNVE